MKGFDEWFENRHTKSGLYEEALCGKADATYIRHEMRKAYLAGQQSKQAEVDELRKRIDDALNVMCKLQYSSGERIYDEVGKILKGDNHE